MERGRKELRPEDVTVLVDTREQLPWDLAPLKQQRLATEEGLPTGDYTVKGLEHLVVLERKSLDDLVGCCGSGRERFEREIQRLLAYPHRAVIVEASWDDLMRGDWRSRVLPQVVTGSVIGWTARGVPFLMAGCRAAAQQAASRFLFAAARQRWREAVGLVESLKVVG